MLESIYSGSLGSWTLSIVRYSKENNVSEIGCFRPQVKEWETPTLLGPLESANLGHWTYPLQFS
jgi:hypothetical protein